MYREAGSAGSVKVLGHWVCSRTEWGSPSRPQGWGDKAEALSPLCMGRHGDREKQDPLESSGSQ